MTAPLFRSLDSTAMATDIRAAQHSVCYAAPGIQSEPANAMVDVARRIGPDLVTVCLDFDERVMRMGFGDLAAVKTLREAGIVVNSTPGLRTGLVIVDHQGYIFTPTALYLEAEDRSAEAPNAMRLSKDQVTEALARLSPAAKAIAIAFAKTDEEKQRIKEQAIEVPSASVADEDFAAVGRRLEEAPPVRFDIARQVRVFNAYLQYIELKLTGAAIQRHRLAIPPQRAPGNPLDTAHGHCVASSRASGFDFPREFGARASFPERRLSREYRRKAAGSRIHWGLALPLSRSLVDGDLTRAPQRARATCDQLSGSSSVVHRVRSERLKQRKPSGR
jgi:hypothetical protein